ncbi:hypothetical protein ACFQ71_02875 [Streptomyces sp. NPDC056534]|uniref:hypothetical protein n=1 Tax=Streptomyces sp. NPDC056534 TaxID=3345857 RepID=UPI0036C2C690
MRPYSILNALPPEAFLKPEDFATEYDEKFPELSEKNYREGLKHSTAYGRIIIRTNSTWAAEDGPVDPITRARTIGTYSCEGIGYHGHTAALLRGFLDGPAPIDVERRQDDGTVTTTRIKEASK